MRVCKWHPDNSNHIIPTRDWPWPLCPECDATVLRRAWRLANANGPVTYSDFGDLPSEQVLRKGGFWQYDVLRTLVDHHGWIRHTRSDVSSWWGSCSFPTSHDPETHFHPPAN